MNNIKFYTICFILSYGFNSTTTFNDYGLIAIALLAYIGITYELYLI